MERERREGEAERRLADVGVLGVDRFLDDVGRELDRD
jgi:hypothetical protein